MLTLANTTRCSATVGLSAIVALCSAIWSCPATFGGTFVFFGVRTVAVCAISSMLNVVAFVLAVQEKHERANLRIRQAGWFLLAGLLLSPFEVLIS